MRSFRLGLLLGIRQIQRASWWSSILIIGVIFFTFLNLVMIGGILIGVVDGAMREVRAQALGDIALSPLDDETRILETERVLATLSEYPEIKAFSARYVGMATIEANFKERQRSNTDPDLIAVNITGIDPEKENQVSNMSGLVGEGEFFAPDESGVIILGKFNIDRYAKEFGDVFDSLKNVYPGDVVRLRANGQMHEFTVKGILDSKVDIIALAAYIPERDFKRIFDRADYNANQIVLRLEPGTDENIVRNRLTRTDLSELAKIRTFTEDIPKFIFDIKKTFELLGLIVGAIGTVVASITIFIIIFINALSRRRQIGIMKAIGITRSTIEWAYVTQAAFYTIIGSALGILITHFIFVPYFIANPINFPFSNASLSISLDIMLARSSFLLGVTVIAGFVPAWLIARQNTLNSILGRK